MQLRFLGTGTSMGVPVIGCDCHVCTSSDPRNRRMRTSALLRTADETILIDAGPDFRFQALAADLRHIDAVLLTHSHFDHIAGIDDLRPLCAKDSC
ncbi:MAG: MBL fold metallo-hydrolase, partial [Oscillochloris sp.]|nr:MBL fold metallo-hydrolase [Oscillochloris sp.]